MTFTAVAAVPASAAAGVAAWRLSEVQLAGPGGDPAARFVELHTGAGGCAFPTTQVAVYDGAGDVLDAAAPFVETTCFDAETYLVLPAPPSMPAAARQVCLRSSGTIYDCVRWGGVTAPVHDLFGPDDDSAAVAPPAGYALARIADTEVIAADWIVAAPTPGAPNDGEPWTPPDGGVPDAAPPADAARDPDAAPAAPDAPPPDARNDRFLDLDPQGGAGCGCQGPGGGAGGLALVIAALATRTRARRDRRRAARAPGS